MRTWAEEAANSRHFLPQLSRLWARRCTEVLVHSRWCAQGGSGCSRDRRAASAGPDSNRGARRRLGLGWRAVLVEGADLQHIAVQLQPHTPRPGADYPGLDGLHHRGQHTRGVDQADQEAPTASASTALLSGGTLPAGTGFTGSTSSSQQCSAKLSGQLGDLLDVGALGRDPDSKLCLLPHRDLPARSRFRWKPLDRGRTPRIRRSVGTVGE